MDAVSIADANKIRAAMGLAPLPVPGAGAGPAFKEAANGSAQPVEEDHVSTLERREAAAGSNWAKLEAERQDKLDRRQRKDAAKKQRDAAQRHAKLQGAGLGDVADGDELDTKSWLMGQKKRQKKIEKKRLQQEEEAAKLKAAQKDYSSKDLKGLRVGHEVDQFEDGEQILTLKDTEIGSDSGEDELENADLLANEKLQEKLDRKKKRPVYDPNEVNEDGQQTVLGQYDEEIQGKKRKRFTLDERGGGSKRVASEDNSAGIGKGLKISLDSLLDEAPVQDYADASTAKIRKPKKAKKERKTRQREADDELEPAATQRQDEDAMNLDGGATDGARALPSSIEEVDDEDLQAQLATQRRQALKKRKKLDVAEFAQQLREASEDIGQGQDDEDEEPGMVIDETREFVAHLERPREDAEDDSRKRREHSTPAGRPKDPDSDGDEEMSDADEAASAQPDAQDGRIASEIHNTTGLDEEDTTSSLGSVAAMLRKRGLIDSGASTAAAKKAASDKRYADFLAKNATLIAEWDQKAREDRERDRASGIHVNLSNMQREEKARQANERRETFLAQLQARHFAENYRPDVKLEYHDEFGRSLGQKEAFKHLSHMFHGKGSGKGKLEKRLKKIEDEKRREGRGMLDGGDGGYDGVMREQGRRRGQAGVRLQ